MREKDQRETAFSISQIKTITPLEAIRKRHWLYATNLGDLVRLFFDDIENYLGCVVNFNITTESVTVSVNEVNFPPTFDPLGRFTVVSLFGVGDPQRLSFSILNALSKRFEIDSFVNGNHWRVLWRNGILIEDFHHVGSSESSGDGIRILIQPDLSFFS